MKLHELINNISEEKLTDYLASMYNEKGISFYINVFHKLKNMKPTISEEPLEILIFEGYDICDEKDYIIEGILPKKEMNIVPSSYEELETFIHRYSFSFTPWSECLSYTINKKTLQDVSPEVILCLIMEELTDFGSDEETILEEKNKLEKALDEAEADIREGRTYTLEDLGYVDKRTEEEKEEALKKMKESVSYNLNQYYEYIKKETL